MANADTPAPPERKAASEQGSLSFEDALERLEAIVDRLEHGELALEDALATFEEGVGLSRRLGEQLGGAERRVEELLREGAGLATRPLDLESE